MRRFSLMAAVVGLLLAVCVPVRAQSEGTAQDEVAMAMAKANAKAAGQYGGAARKAAAVPVPKATIASSDTLVVAAAGPDQPGFTMVGENVTFTDPTFVPYKLREAARRARANADLARIP